MICYLYGNNVWTKVENLELLKRLRTGYILVMTFSVCKCRFRKFNK